MKVQNTILRFCLIFSILFSYGKSSAQSNNALAFDGIDDFVTASAASALIANASGLSLTAWVYPTNPAPSFPNFDGFAGFRNNLDADFYLLHYSANAVEARFRGSSGITYDMIAPVLTLNAWNHLAFTYDGAMLRLYKNGQIVDSLPAVDVITNAAEDFYVGNLVYQGTNFYLSGRVDEISLWDRALSPSELTCLPSNGVDTLAASGLKIYYTCNQGTANGNNTTIPSLQDAAGSIDGTFNGFALNGTTSNFVAGAQAINSVTQFVCPDSSLVWNGQTVTAPGIYTATLVNSNGCDSIVQLNLYSLSVDTSVTQNGAVLSANHVGTYYQWVDCNNGYAPVPGATSKTFTPSVIGSYAVIVLQSGCYDTSACRTVTSVGLQEGDPANLIQVYPTITSGSVRILMNGAVQTLRIRLSDITGRLLFDKNIANTTVYDLDLSSYTKGAYQLTIAGTGREKAFRLIKE